MVVDRTLDPSSKVSRSIPESLQHIFDLSPLLRLSIVRNLKFVVVPVKKNNNKNKMNCLVLEPRRIIATLLASLHKPYDGYFCIVINTKIIYSSPK